MTRTDWSRSEVELVVDDYLEMLSSELAGVTYNKAFRRRGLLPKLNSRSEQSVEFKRANISAALIDLGFPYIAGYKPRSNYQQLLADVVERRLSASAMLLQVAAADADRPVVIPDVPSILDILTEKPHIEISEKAVNQRSRTGRHLTTNYIEREARNRSLGLAGEELVLSYEIERLSRAGKEQLASRVEHTSKIRGDHEGFDILSFDLDGKERLIEVKTTKYGKETPFYVSRNEVEVSRQNSDLYVVYRMFRFSRDPGLYLIPGPIPETCSMLPTTFIAAPR